jgi:capsular polysaccharide transport system permease protein
MRLTALQKLREGWGIQVRVIHALMIRELVTRFGRENIGFLWIMAEPLLFGILVAALWRVLHGPTEHGMGVVAFAVTGYIPVTLFRNGVSRSIAIFSVNSSLLYHRQVTILDLVLARFLVEMAGGMMAYVFIAAVLMVFNEFPLPSDVGLLVAGWLLYALFTLALSLVVAPLSEMSEVLEKFMPVTTYIMIPVSGLFSMASWMTPGVRRYFLWSPFVNCMEMMRKGVFGDTITVYYNIWNPIGCSMVVVMIGLALCRRVRKTLTVQ